MVLAEALRRIAPLLDFPLSHGLISFPGPRQLGSSKKLLHVGLQEEEFTEQL